MTSSVVNDTRIEHEHRVDRPWKRNDETAMTGDREIEIVNGDGYGKEYREGLPSARENRS